MESVHAHSNYIGGAFVLPVLQLHFGHDGEYTLTNGIISPSVLSNTLIILDNKFLGS